QPSSFTNLLRAPDGRTFAVAQRLSAAWDNRDNPFAATRGTRMSGGVEHVNAFPDESASEDRKAAFISHFLRFSGDVSGYFKLTKKGTILALSMAAGYNLQLSSDSETYPDRLFFLGGASSVRAFTEDSVVPEDVAQILLNPSKEAKAVAAAAG